MVAKIRITMKEANLEKLSKLAKAKIKEGVKITTPWVKNTLDSCGYDASESVCVEIRKSLADTHTVVRTKKSGNYGR